MASQRRSRRLSPSASNHQRFDDRDLYRFEILPGGDAYRFDVSFGRWTCCC
jgi:hypothetical protein